MNPDDAFERILASLHQATLDDAHWPATSALIDEAAGASGSALLIGEGLDDDFRIHFARLLRRGESRQDMLRQYFDRYYAHDAGVRRLRGRSAGQLVHIPELYTEEERKSSPAYNEGWGLLGGRDGLNVHFDEPDGLRLVWAIGDPVDRGGWQRGQRQLIERLLPHVRQFVRTRQALAAAGASDAGLAGLLDNSHIGVVQLDRDGRVLAANAPALALLRRGDGLFDSGGTLHARLPGDHERLQKLLGRALPGLWGEVPAAASMTLRRASGGARVALHVSPVGDAQADFGARRVAALVLVVDPAHRARIDPVRVAAAFGLTRSQGRAAALLAEGRSVREIAEVTGWQTGYVRQLLKRIYAKQGVSGQVALVPRVLALDALP